MTQRHVYESLEHRGPLDFLAQVRTRFQDNTEDYDDFLDSFRSYYDGEIDEVALITTVGRLFKGHPDLIAGFSTFLPSEYRRLLADTMI
ncbi:paired amphipathic helix protein Sin3a-like [Aphidius gifuensis]|uniref:paired amphipathic helix protein Sin3a-like n=1 Tax=Aphidius gifuensis TaxID=684658 RepID=UPI001CDC1681|nr:paired amphipathic helix protein Sin3a-like [Aphidius gifuensis]